MTIKRTKELVGEQVRIKFDLYQVNGYFDADQDALNFLPMDNVLELKLNAGHRVILTSKKRSSGMVWIESIYEGSKGTHVGGCWVSHLDLEEIK